MKKHLAIPLLAVITAISLVQAANANVLRESQVKNGYY